MSISYIKTNWVNGTSPALSAANLLNIENAIVTITGSGAVSGLEAQYVTTPDNTKLQPTTGSTKLWTDANDGIGSGLDAGVFCGKSLSVFLYPYDAGRTYSLNDVCHYNGITYRALQTTLGNTPAVGSAYWAMTITTGTSGTVVPFLDGANTYSGVSTFSNTTEASSSTVAGVVMSGGLGVAKKIIGASTIQGTQLISTIATGTAPLSVTSTTEVANLRANKATNLAGGTNGGAIPYQSAAGTTSYLEPGSGGYVLSTKEMELLQLGSTQLLESVLPKLQILQEEVQVLFLINQL